MGMLLEIADSVMAGSGVVARQSDAVPPERVLHPVRSWLRRIGENDPAITREIVEKARTDPVALAWYLEQEAAARADPVRERLSEQLQSDPGLHYALEVVDADSDPVRLIVAVRGAGTAEVTIPADRYDPFRLLEMIGH